MSNILDSSMRSFPYKGVVYVNVCVCVDCGYRVGWREVKAA